jgi:hypothetical protein
MNGRSASIAAGSRSLHGPLLRWLLPMAALLAGCTQPVWYQPADAANPAILTGSRIEEPPLIPDERAYVVAIDGAPVKGFWNTRTPVAPGLHTVQLGYAWADTGGQVPVRIDLAPDARLVVRHESPTGGFAKLWLADETTGQPVTEPFVVPINSGSTTFITVHRGK